MQNNSDIKFLQKAYVFLSGALENSFPKEPIPFVNREDVYAFQIPVEKKNASYLELYISPLAIREINVNAKEYQSLRRIFGTTITDVFYEYRAVFQEEVLDKLVEIAPDYVDISAGSICTLDDFVQQVPDTKRCEFLLRRAEEEVLETYLTNGCGRFRVRIGLMYKEPHAWLCCVLNTDAPHFRCIEDIVEEKGYENIKEKLATRDISFARYAASIETNFYTSSQFMIGNGYECARALRDFATTIEREWKLNIPYSAIGDRFPK